MADGPSQDSAPQAGGRTALVELPQGHSLPERIPEDGLPQGAENQGGGHRRPQLHEGHWISPVGQIETGADEQRQGEYIAHHPEKPQLKAAQEIPHHAAEMEIAQK